VSQAVVVRGNNREIAARSASTVRLRSSKWHRAAVLVTNAAVLVVAAVAVVPMLPVKMTALDTIADTTEHYM
jgi:hypothetical protein